MSKTTKITKETFNKVKTAIAKQAKTGKVSLQEIAKANSIGVTTARKIKTASSYAEYSTPKKKSPSKDDIEKIEESLDAIDEDKQPNFMLTNVFVPKVELDKMSTIRFVTNRIFILGLAIVVAIVLMDLL